MKQETNYGQFETATVGIKTGKARCAAFRTPNGSLYVVSADLGDAPMADESIETLFRSIREPIPPAGVQEKLEAVLKQLHQNLMAGGSAGIAGKRPRLGLAFLLVSDYATLFFESGGCQLILYRFGKKWHGLSEGPNAALGDPGFSPKMKALPVGLENGDIFLLAAPAFWETIALANYEKALLQQGASEQEKADQLGEQMAGLKPNQAFALTVVGVESQSKMSDQLKPMIQTSAEPKAQTHVASRFWWQIFVSFLFFACLVGYLYYHNQQEWENRIEANAAQLDSLQQLSGALQEELAAMVEKESQRAQAVYEYRFDPFDSDNFRIYGLYRDVESRQSELDVALMFNISNANSIKMNAVVGERWFIVPVKGVHYFFEGETLTEIAQKYYEDPADSVLISKFNLDPEPGRRLFIPFGKQ